jgi:hypothetical protein
MRFKHGAIWPVLTEVRENIPWAGASVEMGLDQRRRKSEWEGDVFVTVRWMFTDDVDLAGVSCPNVGTGSAEISTLMGMLGLGGD